MIDRRNLLRGAVLGAGMSAFSGRVLASAGRALASAPLPTDHQLLFVFLRGGNDGVNTLIPRGMMAGRGDPTYGAARPVLAINNGIPLSGMEFSTLNPNLQRLESIDMAGRLAIIHEAGDPSASRSHFTAMDMFEKALAPSPIPSQQALAQARGFVPKALENLGVSPLDGSDLPAAISISALMQAMFRAGTSAQVSAHVQNLQVLGAPVEMKSFGLDTVNLAHAMDHAGAPLNPVDGQLGEELAFGHQSIGLNTPGTMGLINLNRTPQFGAGNGFRFPRNETNLAALANPAVPPLGPANANLPSPAPGGFAFMGAAEDAVATLVQSPNTRVAGVELGGWDTHADQAAKHVELLRWLGWGVRDMFDELVAQGVEDRVTIVVVSEFGRTAFENGSAGTDHGAGGLYMVIGDGLQDGSYNICDPIASQRGPREFGQPWRNLTAAPPDPKYTDAREVVTELRDVLAELLVKRLCLPISSLPDVISGYPASTAGFLGFTL